MPYPINQRTHQFNSIQSVPVSFVLWDTALKFLSPGPRNDVTDHLAVTRAFNTPMESGFKAIKEGLNALQLLENIAGSGQRSQRKRFVVRRRSGKVLGRGWITELGKIKMRDSFEKQYGMISCQWRITVESETRAFT